MRVFLLSCLAVLLIGTGAYFALEKGFAENAGLAFARERTVRMSPQYLPDPRGFLSHPGISPAGEDKPAEKRPLPPAS